MDWKTAAFLPIFKKGDNNVAANYRPKFQLFNVVEKCGDVMAGKKND